MNLTITEKLIDTDLRPPTTAASNHHRRNTFAGIFFLALTTSVPSLYRTKMASFCTSAISKAKCIYYTIVSG